MSVLPSTVPRRHPAGERIRAGDIAGRVLRECDSDALWALATAAADAEQGTMRVISELAAEEAARVPAAPATTPP
jgi:hypothetical protein